MYMSSFGIPIVCKIDGGNMEELKISISKKFNKIHLSQFPSLEKENVPLSEAAE